MSRDEALYLEDLLVSAKKVLRYTERMDRESFAGDERTYDAVVRNLEVMGEAAKHVSEATRTKYTNIPWRNIAGLRDVVAHAYFGLDDDLLWDIIANHVPSVVAELERIRASGHG